MDATYQSVRDIFFSKFHQEPLLVRSPGRINLIGEHTDYNDGFVMPAAIDKEIIFAIAPGNATTSKIFSVDYQELLEVDLNSPQPIKSPAWANYLLGVAHQFVDRGVLPGAINCVFKGHIPGGAGLSSSAAVEGGFAFALMTLLNQNFSRVELAKIGQWAEHNYAGVQCGIMDQFANMLGKEDHLILLDCRSLEYEFIPLQLQDYSIVLINSGVKHSLASSQYNVRRQECEEGVRLLQKNGHEVKSLRDVTLKMLNDSRNQIQQPVFNRCRYVVEENNRVMEAATHLRNNNLKTFGEKLFESHQGLSKFYEVSCEETDYLVSLVQDHEGVIGARMMGGGFGGCTINLIHRDAINMVLSKVSENYYKRFKMEAETYHVEIKGGTNIITA